MTFIQIIHIYAIFPARFAFLYKKGVVKKRRSKSQDFLLLGNLGSFLCQIAKITILAEFWVQQTQRHKNCVFAVLKIWKIF